MLSASLSAGAITADQPETSPTGDLLEKAFHDSPIGKVLATPLGEVKVANKALGELLGVDPRDLMNRHLSEFVWPPDLEEAFASTRPVFCGQVDQQTRELRIQRGDGSWGWVRVHAAPIRDESTAVREVIFQVVDIDAAKRAGQALTLQARLLDEVHNAVVAADLEGTLTYWNRYAEHLLGYSSEEMMGRHLSDLIGQGQYDWVVAELAETGSCSAEERIRRPDGSDVTLWTTWSLVRDEADCPVGLVRVSADLGPIKAAESLAEQRGRLAESVLSSVIFPVAVIDSEGKITSVNHAWRRACIAQGGNPAQSGVGVNYLEACRRGAPDPTAQAALAGIEDVLCGRRDSFSLQYPCQSPSEERWFEMQVTPIAGGGAVIAHWDVTADRRVRSALRETIEAKDRFIASVSHELRTPLTGVVGLAEMLREGGLDPRETAELAALLAEQAWDLSMLVDDLLIAARVETDTLVVRPAVVDIAAEIESVLTAWKLGDEAEVSAVVVPGVMAWADGGRVRQILRSLLRNAARYGAPPVAVSACRAGTEVVVTVTDHGPGVPEDHVHRLFDHYAVFSDDGRPLGLGLGLPVARELAVTMGGSLDYERRGERTVFTLRLPATPD